MTHERESLRIALLTYRGNPYSGGQGVYVRQLSAALRGLGHEVDVLSGPPYPELVEGVGLDRLESLDLYRAEAPFRPHRRPRSDVDLLELALMCTGAFPEPLTFGIRARRHLRSRGWDHYDVVHDNQCLAYGILGIARRVPVLSTIHHPITVDRRINLTHAESALRRLSVRRFYSFIGMQVRVARRLPKHITVSEASRADICREMGVRPEQIDVVPVGVDPEVYRPRPEIPKMPNRILTIASADGPLKGVPVLLEALAKVRTEREAHLVLVGRVRPDGPARSAARRFGVEDAVTFAGGVDDDTLMRLYAEASVAVVPSLYEGFSLPAVQAMSCGLPLVATTGGALPEVLGPDGGAGLLVPPDDPEALAAALGRVLDEPNLREGLAEGGRARVLNRLTWEATARGTVEHYRDAIERFRGC